MDRACLASDTSADLGGRSLGDFVGGYREGSSVYDGHLERANETV